jgi:hypothetical protein
MPIRAENRWLYPIDWPQLSASIRFGRTKGRCEHCRRPHLARVWHLGDGRWWEEEGEQWLDGQGRGVQAHPTLDDIRQTYVVLACAHLNHDPTYNAPRNLAALCQRCHLAHDAREHRHRRWRNRFIRQALRDFFDVNLRQWP